MPKFVDGELGSSVRAKLNTVIDKVEGAATIDNDITISGDLTAEGVVKVGTGTGTAGGDVNMVTTGSSSAFLNLKGGAGRAKVVLANDSVTVSSGTSDIVFNTGAGTTNIGTAVARVTSDGLAIGTTALDAGNKLQVEGGDIKVSDTVATLTLEDSDDPSNAYTQLKSYGGVAVMDVDPGNNGAVASSFRVNIDGSEVARVTSDGMSVTGTVDITDDLSLTNASNSPLIMRESTATNGYQIRPNVGSSADYGLLFERLDGRNWYVMGGQVRSHAFYDNSETEALVIDHGGQVGIKNTNPSYSLDVSGDIRLSDADPQIRFSDETYGNTHRIIASSGHLFVQAQNRDNTSNNGQLYLTGINSVDAARIEARASIFEVENNGTSRLYINASGDVGLGTTGPAERLDVNGSILARGNLTAHQYHTRADFVADTNRAAGLANGDIVMAEGLFYEYSSGSTVLSPPLNDFVPAGTVQPEHFGAVGNGVANDHAALAKFFAYIPGFKAQMGAGKTYVDPSNAVHYSTAAGTFIDLDGNGATIDTSGRVEDTSGDYLAVNANLSLDPVAISAVSASTGYVQPVTDSGAQDYTTDITRTSGTFSGLYEGQRAILRSDDTFPPAVDGASDDQEYVGQWVTLRETAAANGSTTVKVIGRIRNNYTTNPKLVLFNAATYVSIRNLKLVGTARPTEDPLVDSTDGMRGIGVYYAERVHISDIHAIRYDRYGITVRNCADVNVERCTMFHDEKTANNAAVAYGIEVNDATERVSICDNTLNGSRHGIDLSRSGGGVTRYVNIARNTIQGTWRAAIATHGNHENLVIADNNILKCADGINVRCPNTIVKGNYIEGCRVGVNFTDTMFKTSVVDNYIEDVSIGIAFADANLVDNPQDFIGDVYIAGNRIKNCAAQAIRLTPSPSGSFSGEVPSTTQLGSLLIADNFCDDVTDQAIWINGKWSNPVVDGLQAINCSSGKPVVFYEHATLGGAIRNVTYSTGNAPSAVSTIEISSNTGGVLRPATFSGGMSIDDPGYSRHHVLRDVGMWSTNTSLDQGALVVQLGGLGNTFISATITIFRNYHPPVDVHVWGYSRSGDSDWLNEGARVSDPSIVSEVRFARGSTNNYPYVILSNNATPTSSTWSNYIQVRIKEITIAWTGADEAFNQNPDNYVTTLTSDISGYTIDNTITPTSAPVNVQRYTNDIAFYDDTGSQAVFFDASTSRLGIGETAPIVTLDVDGSARIQSTMQVNELIRQATKTVATLPTSGVFAGDRSFVTDATATIFGTVVVGLGSNKVPVYYDGTNWRIG